MPRPSAPLRRTALAVAVALAAVGAAAYPAAASSGRDRLAGTHAARAGDEAVELQLTPRDRAGLARLATTTGLSRATRLARLSPLLAGTARARTVAATLRREGLNVTSTGELGVTATGPAATVAALFGTAQATDLATAQPLPRIPAALRGLVTAAYGGDDARPAELPLDATRPATRPSSAASPSDGTLSIAQTRSLYGTTATTASPSSSAPIVATLQFTTSAVVAQAISNDNTFAADNDLYADSTYRASTNVVRVPVDTGCTATAGDDDGDEVALDTQTLLAVSPQLRQRVYQADNCGNSQDLAISQIVSDVQAGMPIVALSTSWGECEKLQYGSTAADVDAVDSLLAAGVTMFAATGDDGANDCNIHPGADAVDSPAVLPGVVAVGGTTGTTAASETPWDDGAGSATGGGFSCGFFARPSYQADVAKPASYPHNGYDCPAGSSERMVPDISANGGNGLDVVATDSDGTNTDPVYGTSFSAPLAAGGYAETLLHLGITTAGLGDIHSYLYADHGFLDIRQGSNGEYTASTGYDLASGLGTPSWPTVLTSGTLVGNALTTSGVHRTRRAPAPRRAA